MTKKQLVSFIRKQMLLTGGSRTGGRNRSGICCVPGAGSLHDGSSGNHNGKYGVSFLPGSSGGQYSGCRGGFPGRNPQACPHGGGGYRPLKRRNTEELFPEGRVTRTGREIFSGEWRWNRSEKIRKKSVIVFLFPGGQPVCILLSYNNCRKPGGTHGSAKLLGCGSGDPEPDPDAGGYEFPSAGYR